MQATLKTLENALDGHCEWHVMQQIHLRLLHWNWEADALFYKFSEFPKIKDLKPYELQVSVLMRNAIVDIRISNDGNTETLIPLQSIDRVRLIEKEEKTQIELRHGDCITWLETGKDVIAGSDIREFLISLQTALTR